MRCLELAEAHGDSALGLAALWWAACNAPKSDAGKKALAILEGGRLARADFSEMMFAIERATPFGGPGPTSLVRLVLERVKLHLDHPQAPRLLTWVCANDYFERGQQESPTFAEAADLIAAHFARRPGIQHFCECLAPIDRISPPWAGKYEKHLRTILEKNSDRFVRCSAQFALASVVRSTGESREDEAAILYQQFIDQFKEHTNPGTSHIEEMYVDRARKELARIKAFAIGQPAPEIEGPDLDGRPMKLSQFRGNVVLVSFWETSTDPSMKLVAQERSLLDRLKGKPFSIVGVSGDFDPEEPMKTPGPSEVTWWSFQNSRADKTAISSEWRIFTWPTLFLVDHLGIIRQRWDGIPPAEVLNREIEQLVVLAEAAANKL